MSKIGAKARHEGLGLKKFRMRKKFVQTLAARQLQYGEDIGPNEEMDCGKQPSTEQQQQADGSAEEIIEILDDDQEVELMMERHRKYHPRKYVNLQHPPSKIYYDKIDKVVSPLGDREDQEDEDERNQLVIEEYSPKEPNNNSISIGGNTVSGNVGGTVDDSVLPLGSSLPANGDEAYLLQEYHYRRLYGGYGGQIPLNVAPGGRPTSREQQEPHQQRLKKSTQRPLDLPGPLMGPPAYPHPVGHPPPYERSHPYGQRPVSYDRSVPAPQIPYYRRKDTRRMSLHERPRVPHAGLNGSFVVPETRTEFAKVAGNRNSAFSPPRDKGLSTTRVSESNKPRPPAPPAVTVASAVVTPRTPIYYQQPHAYHQSGTDGAIRPREANGYLTLEECYQLDVPSPHVGDLRTMLYYHYYMDKMAAVPSVYHHPYRDHTLTTATSMAGPGIGAIGGGGGTVPPGSGSVAALAGSPSYPPPQYGFAKNPIDHTALYGSQQQPFDYTVYQTVLAQSGYRPTPTCQSQTAISAAPLVPSTSATSSSALASEIIRPTVINRAPIPSAVPQNAPRTVPVNLVHHPPTPPAAHGGGPTATTVAFPPVGSSRSEHEPTILKPLLTRPLAGSSEGEDGRKKRHGGDGGRTVANVATATTVSAPAASSAKSKPNETVPSPGGSSVMSKATPPSTTSSPQGDKSASRIATPPFIPATHIIPLTMQTQPSRPRGRPPGAKNKESAAARAAKASAASAAAASSASGGATGAKAPNPPALQRLSSTTIQVRVDCMKQEVECFLNRRRTEVITTMRLYSIGRIEYDGLLQEMKRHSIVYRDFLTVAYELMKNARLPGFVREPPAELDYRWKSPPQEFADYFAKNEQCNRTFVRENFDFLVLIVDNLLKQYFEPLEYFLLTYVLGLRVK